MENVSARTGRRPVWRAAAAVAMGLPLVLTMGLGAQQAAAAPEAETPAVAASPQSFKDGNYIVVLKEAPVASYDGGVPGLAATQPERGKKLDAGDRNVKAYQAHLRKAQKAVAKSQKVAVQRDFTTALNGFQANLTARQAQDLSKDKNVLSVSENVQFAPDYASVDYLGLRGEDGVWAEEFKGERNAGRGVVVGVIDTGYLPSSPYLEGSEVSALPGKKKAKVGEPYRGSDGAIAMLKSDGTVFKGECEVGEGFDGSLCNDKVLSARYFADDFLKFVPEEKRAPEEVISPVDIGSHGTHTASTAAGNNDTQQTVNGRDFGTGSGVAPSAKVSVYKICWEDTDPNTGGCYTAASVAAIEQAILDGVDVLNYSISGNNNSVLDPVATAFKNAAAAGVFVAASAGNSGPTVSTVNHASPWLTTVAASTFSAELTGTVEMEDGTKYRGVSVASREVLDTELVLAADAGRTGATNPELCLPDTIDPAKAEGKIVVCDRGVNARVEKSQVVGDAGAVGMVLVNLSPMSEDSDIHAVPTVHISNPAIKEQVASNPGITGTIRMTDTTGLPSVEFPQIAGFSSRGPTLAEGSDLLKPDLATPGVNVMSGVVPARYNGDTAGFMSGTSMASPHAAGMGALMLGKYPTWSPAAVKSAMMTTAYDAVKAGGSADLDNFATGAGMADPGAMTAPGLVYDNGVDDWNAMLDGELEAKDLNLASYALGNLIGETTVTRTVTATTKGTYTASADVPGVDVTVSPSKLAFKKAGESKTFTVTFKRTTAEADRFAHGSLTWAREGGKGGGATVTSPVSVRPVTVQAPAVASFESESGEGSGVIDVVGGVDRTVDLSVNGLAKADSTTTEKVPGGSPSAREDASNGIKNVTVPAGSTSATFAVNADDATDDWDLFLITPAGTVVQAATASASERIVLNAPAAGNYRIIANLYSTSDGGPATASMDFVALADDAGNLEVSPDPLELVNGEPTAITAAWSGLESGVYFGKISLDGTGKSIGVQVSVGGAAAAAESPVVLTGDEAAKLPKSSLK